MNKGAVDLYLKQVKKELRCLAKQKCAFLAELETGLRELAQESSDLTMDKLIDAFGTPQKQAQDFMETLDASEIKKSVYMEKSCCNWVDCGAADLGRCDGGCTDRCSRRLSWIWC